MNITRFMNGKLEFDKPSKTLIIHIPKQHQTRDHSHPVLFFILFHFFHIQFSVQIFPFISHSQKVCDPLPASPESGCHESFLLFSHPVT